MSTFYKVRVFAASKDVSKTSIKLVSPKFGESTVWLNLRTAENKPDFGAQKVLSEGLRSLIGSGEHIQMTIHSDEIVRTDKGSLEVKVTLAGVEPRLEKVTNAERDDSEDQARQILGDLFPTVVNKPEPTTVEEVELF